MVKRYYRYNTDSTGPGHYRPNLSLYISLVTVVSFFTCYCCVFFHLLLLWLFHLLLLCPFSLVTVAHRSPIVTYRSPIVTYRSPDSSVWGPLYCSRGIRYLGRLILCHSLPVVVQLAAIRHFKIFARRLLEIQRQPKSTVSCRSESSNISLVVTAVWREHF